MDIRLIEIWTLELTFNNNHIEFLKKSMKSANGNSSEDKARMSMRWLSWRLTSRISSKAPLRRLI